MFEYLVFEEHVGIAYNREVRIEVDGCCLRYRIDGYGPEMQDSGKGSGVYIGNTEAFLGRLDEFCVPGWKVEYFRDCLDGYNWSLRYKEVGKPCRKISGFNDGPDCYEDFTELLFSISKEGIMPKREGKKKEIISEISEKVADEILKLKIGSKTTISDLVSSIFTKRGYSLIHISPEFGWVWTKDDGATYAITDMDQFDILDAVEEILDGKRELDFSEHDGMLEGYPYNLDFIVRNVE